MTARQPITEEMVERAAKAICREKFIFENLRPAPQALSQPTRRKTIRLVPATPDVKSANFENQRKCDAALSRRVLQNRKNRGPHLLDSSCRMEIHRDGLFEIVERKT